MADIGFDAVGKTIGRATAAAEDSLQNFLATMDPNNARDLTLLQVESNKWNLVVSLESNMHRLLADTLKGVVQKIA